jgi:hypothetical protein
VFAQRLSGLQMFRKRDKEIFPSSPSENHRVFWFSRLWETWLGNNVSWGSHFWETELGNNVFPPSMFSQFLNENKPFS